MAYDTGAIMSLLRQRGMGGGGGGGMPVGSVSDEMRQPGGRLRWLNKSQDVQPMMMAGGDSRGVVQKLRDMISGRGGQIDESVGSDTGQVQGGEAAPATAAPEAYTFEHGGKTFHRDANNQLWVLRDGQWVAIEGLWEE